MKSMHLIALPLAASIAGLITVPNYAQSANKRGGEKISAAVKAKKQAKLAGVSVLDTRALLADGSHGVLQGDEGAIAGAPFQNWTFEAPTFNLGPISGQGTPAWLAFQGCAAAPPNNESAAKVNNIGTALGGSQWVTVNKGSCAVGFSAGPFGPTTAQAAGTFTASCKVVVNDVGGADYDALFQAPSIGDLSARVKFYYDDFDGDLAIGDILVVTDVDGSGPAAAAYVDSGVDYVQGQAYTIKVELNGPGNSLKYYINGSLVASSQLIYNTANFTLADRIEQFALLSDNYQNNAIDFGQVDDIKIEPGIAVACVTDINGDTQVNVSDLLAVITNWGASGANPADIAGPSGVGSPDGTVNVTDLLAVITSWGACP